MKHAEKFISYSSKFVELFFLFVSSVRVEHTN